MNDLFEYTNYRTYILDWIASQPKRGRGVRAAMAKAIRSPVSHISQVLSGVSNFTLEQAEETNEFFGHTTDQAEYFLLLVHHSRAGTAKLKHRMETQIRKIQEKRLILTERLAIKDAISSEHQAQFYSSWLYAAIHVLLTIEEFQTKESIAKFLGLPLKRVTEILDFLVNMGLAARQDSRFIVGTARMHLGNDSPMISKHHINWRIQAIRALERADFHENLHYSSVVSISKKDITKIKSLLVKAIEEAKLVIRDSKEEELHSLCLDFFQI
jgi:uncharacterized protein (TIGR02147 family)